MSRIIITCFLTVVLNQLAYSQISRYNQFDLGSHEVDVLLDLKRTYADMDSLLEINLAINQKLGKATEEGMRSLEDFIEIASSKSDSFGVHFAYLQSVDGYLKRFDYETASNRVTACLNYFNQKDSLMFAWSHLVAGDLYFDLKDYTRSLEYYQSCNSMLTRSANAELLQELWHHKANFYGAIERIDSSVFYYTKIINQCKDRGICFKNTNAVNNLRQLYSIHSIYDKESAIIDDAIKAYEDRIDDRGKYFFHKNSARKYRMKKRFAEALPHQRAMLHHAISLNEEFKEAVALEQMAYCHSELSQMDSSLFFLKRMEAVTLKNGNLAFLKNAYDKLASHMDYFGRQEEAIAYYKLSDKVSKDINDEEEKIKLLKFEQRTRLEKEEKVSEALRAKNAVLAAEAKARKMRNLLLSLLSLILGLFLFYLYRTLKVKRRQNALLDEQKKVIETNLKEKELLLKEIHHRVKNNLQMVSGLLNLQSEYIKDNAAIAAIRDGKNRVSSMALIHQNLYQGDLLSGVNVRTYFERLIKNLEESYNLKRQQIEIEWTVDDLVFDTDTMISLGLVCNELLTNAIKYAYPDGGGKVLFTLVEHTDMIYFEVRDNGVGIDVNKLETSESFGYRMIKAFSQKLNAQLEIDNMNGSRVSMRFSKKEEV